MNTIETEFSFDEYIMPTTTAAAAFSTMHKVESFDAQLYPSAFGYYNDSNGFDHLTQTPIIMSTAPGSYNIYQSTTTLPQSTTELSSSNNSQQGSSSPESYSSRLSPPIITTPLLSPTTESQATTTTTTITEKIANVNKLPESFLPEFHQYSKETYENGISSNKKKRRRSQKRVEENDGERSSDEDGISAQEVRRQIHIQSEQKRRAQIKDGFEELRQHLPGCINKKMSKAALLHRTVQHLQHLKKNQSSLLTELERMMKENEQLRKFQDSVLQKQALERMYQISM
ncbi:uncharacterized protein BX663DRAFT_440411 [Cokeromyces recurvatus]|uniref:uncharacterized protein n=1 Tax=Cokeromyces recurvatus TaxID=90255 RepID=UPI00221E539E|nr:uncharacterized protein BX663DRAFT_440411 [Cokeromyces recurvatus]KAI7899829.1 hypothetical protein BX663DRAFT_440411 [Cokeromyces recurvatus]